VMKMDVRKLEEKKTPKGHVVLVGLGRLGIRTGINLVQTHMGGPRKITAIDGQRISKTDLIHQFLGGRIGEYKVDLLLRFSGNKKVVPIRENITEKNLDLIKGDVVCIEIAGGNTIPTTAAIIKKAWRVGTFTISTAGVFGIGYDDISVMDISKADLDNPAVYEFRRCGINKNHKIVTTGKFIRDEDPIAPYVLDDIAKFMTREILKALEDISSNSLEKRRRKPTFNKG